MSIEVDILPIADTNDDTARLADLIEAVAGEFSPFEELHGFSIDGVDLDTAVLPDGWRSRLVEVQNANTAAPAGEPRFTGWCLDKEDLCVAKLIALRERTATSSALHDAGLVNPDLSIAAINGRRGAPCRRPAGPRLARLGALKERSRVPRWPISSRSGTFPAGL
jgi:hypothetical protein